MDSQTVTQFLAHPGDTHICTHIHRVSAHQITMQSGVVLCGVNGRLGLRFSGQTIVKSFGFGN